MKINFQSMWFPILGLGLLSAGCGASADAESESVDGIGQATQCGSTQDFQNVEQYNGNLGVTRDFVDDHQAPVGMLLPIGCSGTMISNNQFITAGHCNIAVGNTVRFNNQVDAAGNPRPTTDYTVDSVVENKLGGLDYSIATLRSNPTLGDAGVAFGWARVGKKDPASGDTLAIIGHPAVMPKMIEAGTKFGFSGSSITYSDIDTLGGNSGSGILSAKLDAFVGVHTNGGCTTTGGSNSGVRLSSLLANSTTVTNLSKQLSHNANAFLWSSGLTGSFTADATYSSTSNNTVTQLSTGRYRVDFPGVGGETGGNVQVTAYGGSNERCKVESWGSSGTTMSATVRCNTPNGALTNSLFTISYVGRAGVVGVEGGYVWANQPTTTDYTPNVFFQWNSAGRGNRIHRNGTGSYTVSLTKLGPLSGTVEVTAYGTGSQYCKVQNWGPGGEDQQVNVGCFTATGAPTDTQFALVFSAGSPNGTSAYTYAWSSDATSPSVTPSLAYQRGFIGGDGPVNGGSVITTPVTMDHSQTGFYSVHLPQMSDAGGTFGKSNVKVTGYGFDNTTCKIMGWGNNGSGVDASVQCHDTAGNAADALFTITYSSTQFIIG
jgi:hypothetical protein